MEIALVAPLFPPHFEGGSESVVRAQARELVHLGHHVRILAGTDRPHDGNDVEHALVDGIEVVFLARKADEFQDFDLLRPRIARLLDQWMPGAELVHVHQHATLHSQIVRRARAAGLPVVMTLHDLFLTCPRYFRLPPDPSVTCPPPREFETCARCIAPDVPWSMAEIRAGFVRRHAWVEAELAAAAAVVAPSRAQAETFSRYVRVDPARLHVVPHGLSDPLPRVVTSGWGGRGPLRVVFLGHRSDVKGVRELVAGAAALAPAERARLELLFLGDALVAGLDEELVRLAAGLTLVFAGNYRSAELAARFRTLGPVHLGAFPSRAYESYGLVPDELQALGVPVWVTDRGAPQERVGAAGRVLPVEDPGAWTAALRAVLADPQALERERKALPERARGAADAARELDALYRSLVAR